MDNIIFITGLVVVTIIFAVIFHRYITNHARVAEEGRVGTRINDRNTSAHTPHPPDSQGPSSGWALRKEYDECGRLIYVQEDKWPCKSSTPEQPVRRTVEARERQDGDDPGTRPGVATT